MNFKKAKILAYIFIQSIFIYSIVFSDNPLIWHKFTADPGIYYINNRMYILCSHDLDSQTSSYDMYDFTLISSDDLVNWTDHGEVISVPRDASWATLAWAPAMVYRNGYYYVYFGNGANNIGVLRSTSPTGPFTDPLGRPLITRNMPNCNVAWLFDPAVFIDDDGQAYLYFGGGGPGNARVIRLNPDMISVNGSAVTIDAPQYFEAPFMHKRNGIYYFSYSSDFSQTAARIDYMTSNNPMTGFTYRGTILDNPPDNCYNNNHASIVNIGDNWYIAYHNRRVSNIREGNCVNIYHRSVCLDRLYYNADGTIQKVIPTNSGVAQLKYVNPYIQNEAETFDNEQYIETEVCSEGGMNVGYIENGDWIRITGVDFGSGASSFEARVASGGNGGNIEIRLGSPTGTLVGTCSVPVTGGWQTWQTVTCSVSGATGVQNLYLRFTGGSGYLFNINWWRFYQSNPSTPTRTPTLTRTPTNTATPTPVVQSIWRVRAGATQSYTDSQGNVWVADTNYSGGLTYSTTATIANALPSATDQALYQTERYGTSFTYTFYVPAGTYQVTLKFAETFWTSAGARVFNVRINGIQVLTNFDIYVAAGGANRAIDQVFNNINASGGVITIEFIASVENAKVDAIQVIPQPATPTPTRTFTATNTQTSTLTNTMTNTRTSTRTNTPTYTSTVTLSSTNTNTSTLTNTYTFTSSITSTGTNTATQTPTYTNTRTMTITYTNTSTSTRTQTATNTFTMTVTFTATFTVTGTETQINTPTLTLTGTNTRTPTYTNTQTFTVTNTISQTNTSTWAHTFTGTTTNTITRTETQTPELTKTWTPSATQTFTMTASATFTGTVTKTWTETAQPTMTWTATATQTIEEVGLIIEKVVIMPNPYRIGNKDLRVSVEIKGKGNKVKVNIYTIAYRLIKQVDVKGEYVTGKNIIEVDRRHIERLSNGIYYIVVSMTDNNGKQTSSKPVVLVVLR